MNYEPGMVLAFRWDSATYGVCKVVRITETKKEPIISIVTYSNSYEALPESVDMTELKPMVAHMPMLLPAMEKSGCTIVGTAPVTPEELASYERWAAAWQERRAGFFDTSIPDAVYFIMEQMARVDTPEDPMFRERMMRQFMDRMPK